MTAALSWVHTTREIPDEGLSVERCAVTEELEGLAEALHIVDCERLLVRYTLRPMANRRFRLQGDLEADVVQSCVVTLEPVRSRLAESFKVEFWPSDAMAHTIDNPGSGDQRVFSPDDPEPIVGNRLEIGRVVGELLTVALDPYPRVAGTHLDPASDQATNTSRTDAGQFAALAGWKPKRE